jgi:hypothetical protein
MTTRLMAKWQSLSGLAMIEERAQKKARKMWRTTQTPARVRVRERDTVSRVQEFEFQLLQTTRLCLRQRCQGHLSLRPAVASYNYLCLGTFLENLHDLPFLSSEEGCQEVPLLVTPWLFVLAR